MEVLALAPGTEAFLGLDLSDQLVEFNDLRSEKLTLDKLLSSVKRLLVHMSFAAQATLACCVTHL